MKKKSSMSSQLKKGTEKAPNVHSKDSTDGLRPTAANIKKGKVQKLKNNKKDHDD